MAESSNLLQVCNLSGPCNSCSSRWATRPCGWYITWTHFDVKACATSVSSHINRLCFTLCVRWTTQHIFTWRACLPVLHVSTQPLQQQHYPHHNMTLKQLTQAFIPKSKCITNLKIILSVCSSIKAARWFAMTTSVAVPYKGIHQISQSWAPLVLNVSPDMPGYKSRGFCQHRKGSFMWTHIMYQNSTPSLSAFQLWGLIERCSSEWPVCSMQSEACSRSVCLNTIAFIESLHAKASSSSALETLTSTLECVVDHSLHHVTCKQMLMCCHTVIQW